MGLTATGARFPNRPLNQAQYQTAMETLRGRLEGPAIARQRTHRNRGPRPPNGHARGTHSREVGARRRIGLI
jgi:hypothetical protein